MRALIFVVLSLIAGAILLVLFGDLLVAWANAQQKSLQSELARALLAVRGGDVVAVATVVGVCGLYGVIHAIGPGHGKLLIGGAALASRRTAYRMAGLGLAASMAQGATAIVLVYGGLGVFSVASRSIVGVSEGWLTATSYLAIAAVGGWILWRGARLAASLMQAPADARVAAHGGCASGCRHAPTAQEAEEANDWRQALALIASIGVRPCSGALIVLALSWRFDTLAVGLASVIAMAFGTGLVVAAVALAAVRLREAGGLTEASPLGRWGFAAVQLGVGTAIVVISVSLAAAAFDRTDRAHPLMQTFNEGHPRVRLSGPWSDDHRGPEAADAGDSRVNSRVNSRLGDAPLGRLATARAAMAGRAS